MCPVAPRCLARRSIRKSSAPETSTTSCPSARQRCTRSRAPGKTARRMTLSKASSASDRSRSLRDPLVRREEQLVEPAAIEHLGQRHAGPAERGAREHAEAAQRVGLVGEVEDGRVQQVGAHQGAVDVEEAGGHGGQCLWSSTGATVNAFRRMRGQQNPDTSVIDARLARHVRRLFSYPRCPSPRPDPRSARTSRLDAARAPSRGSSGRRSGSIARQPGAGAARSRHPLHAALGRPVVDPRGDRRACCTCTHEERLPPWDPSGSVILRGQPPVLLRPVHGDRQLVSHGAAAPDPVPGEVDLLLRPPARARWSTGP